MSEPSETLSRSSASHEPDTNPSFTDFLLAQSQIADADPMTTCIEFDLDETMFRRNRDYSGSTPPNLLVGSWRPDMPDTLLVLRQKGFRVLDILSSADIPYIQAAMKIYAQQFGDENASRAFDNLRTTRDYDDRFGHGNKYEAFPEVARRAAELGLRTIFVDDGDLSFDSGVSFGYVNVPTPMRYYGNKAVEFTTEIENSSILG